MMRLRSRVRSLVAVVSLAAVGAACNNTLQTGIPVAPSAPPVSVTETFSGDLTVNGAVTHPFAVSQAGLTSAALAALDPADATVGVSLGTWNGQVCQIILANDNATQNITVIGEARSAGNFCVRIYDVGKLTGLTGYRLTVTHF